MGEEEGDGRVVIWKAGAGTLKILANHIVAAANSFLCSLQ